MQPGNPAQPKRFVQLGNPRGLGSPSRPGGFGNPTRARYPNEPGAPRSLGTRAASAITRKHRKYQHEIHQTIFDHLSDLSCWRDLEIHITAADPGQHLWNGHLVRRSMSGLIKLDAVRETGKFLIEIMPLMFIPAGVGLMDSWGNLHSILLPVAIITIVTNITVMGSTGLLSQWVIRRGRKLAEEKTERKRGAYHE